VTFAQARTRLKDALAELPRLARALERPAKRAPRALDAPVPAVWSLALDEIQETGVELRPRLPFGKARTATGPRRAALRAPARPLSEVLTPLRLDPPTVVDDAEWAALVAHERNLPAGFAQELLALV
jgi:hypothetical protein